jgi:hypothetical protein
MLDLIAKSTNFFLYFKEINLMKNAHSSHHQLQQSVVYYLSGFPGM